MSAKYIVELSRKESDAIAVMLDTGTSAARTLKRAQVLRLADHDQHDDAFIVEALDTSISTVHRIRQRFVEGGLQHALHDKRRPGGARKLTGKQEALLIARACSKPPKGAARWTLQLLADDLVALTDLESISSETIRRRLKEKVLKPWQEDMWCIPTFNARFVAQMEDVLDLYAQPADPARPVVNFDETLKQLVGEVREPIPAKPGRQRRYDYHYKRNGSANLFVFFDRHRRWRHVEVTKRKTNADFSACLKALVDVHYPDAEVIRVVMDNLSTHTESALYQTFEPAEARRILRRLEFHYTPVHASWLNMVEIEISVLARQCLDRRIGDIETLAEEVAAWEERRNKEAATIEWLFNLDKARTKLSKAYPHLSRSMC